MPVILTDTTVLSNFAQVGRPQLLQSAFPDLSAPAEVRQELTEGERLGLVPSCDWSWMGMVELSSSEQLQAAELRRSLQAGEAACIAIVLARGGLLLTDDLAARRVAASLQVEISGTLGVLARLIQRKILTLEEGDELLVRMMASGYRSPVRSLREIEPHSPLSEA
jgi:predicted nucleic acid-binding protein